MVFDVTAAGFVLYKALSAHGRNISTAFFAKYLALIMFVAMVCIKIGFFVCYFAHGADDDYYSWTDDDWNRELANDAVLDRLVNRTYIWGPASM